MNFEGDGVPGKCQACSGPKAGRLTASGNSFEGCEGEWVLTFALSKRMKHSGSLLGVTTWFPVSWGWNAMTLELKQMTAKKLMESNNRIQ